MTETTELRNWLFKTLLADGVLDGLEADGLSVRAEVDPKALQRVIPLEAFSAEVRRAAMAALPAYLAFFCFENAVRELVNERMSENHGPDWWETNASQTMKTAVHGRQEKEGEARWHDKRGEHPVYYTDFGDLRRLIINNWEEFADLLPDQNWVIARLTELESSRNVIAHSNVLDKREVDRIKLYLEDWTRQVG